ncbi:hypothetical protein [Bosea sp. BK604]|uniref:hypothetical protein n=1 Tax=Bosea sp. BK604 TaxID=2512180 RepID=UPI00105386F7|nr:hypothetical protein [Bosea sp. BK604]TCR64734.1 hypothetical protein EV560_106200 [Bosea sp. BK604]
MFDPTTLTGFHTWLSLIAIAAGFFVIPALLKGHMAPGWTGTFLSTAFATSATGFAFPFNGVLPSHIFGVVSLILIGLAGYGLYARMLEGAWRRIYAICVVIAHYLLCFVGVFQAFLKVPALKALAPTQSEPPFAIAQGLLFLVFAVLTWLCGRRFAAGPTVHA